MSKRNICEAHGDILDIINKRMARLNYSTDDTTEYLVDMIDDLLYYTGIIEDLTKEAMEYGQSMENRLIAYRSAIEDLGFRRNEK